jgi:crotonobetainyl-CoA:carnitine CoA-transferase CaiB-like acyl-CoA transferase
VALGFAGGGDQWQMFCGILGLADLIDDQRFNTGPKRTARHAELEPVLEAAFGQRTTGEWLKDLMAAGIPCGPLNTIPQAVADEQVQHRGMIRPVTHHTAGTIPIANTPVRMTRSESGIKGPPPDYGQHTADVLAELLGIDAAAVADLEERGVVATKGGPDLSQVLD